MFELKDYQKRVLACLRKFFDLVPAEGAAAAYKQVANSKEAANPYAEPSYYMPPVAELADRPHVCARIPTGGGKTYLAAATLEMLSNYRAAANPHLSPARPIVWMTPTETIRKQTAAMLQNPDHPCCQEIKSALGDSVRVLDIDDFDNLTAADAIGSGNIEEPGGFIVVSTAAMFAVQQTTRENDKRPSRRIYASNECFYPHFARLLPSPPPMPAANASGLHLEYDSETGNVKKSFVNLLHLLRPVVVLDEAHRFVSPLSRTVLRRINPSCIMEWTATPRRTKGNEQLHNILVSAKAQELQDEEMIKLPLVVGEHPDWETAVQAAVAERESLKTIAKDKDSEVRPMVLYKATTEKGNAPPETLKERLITTHKVPEGEIAIHTGDIRELDGVDLFKTGIRHIITKEALREGWDCPFAYVLCVAGNIHGDTPAEQFLGRVMRMPFAQKRPAEELNRAYAHLPSGFTSEAVEEIRKKLSTDMGFDEHEARRAAVEQGTLSDEPLWDNPFHVQTEKKPDFSELEKTERKEAETAVQAERNEKEGGWTVKITGAVSPSAQEAIMEAVEEKKRPQQRRRLHHALQRHFSALSHAKEGKKFADLPRLMFDSPERGKNTELDDGALYELASWNEIGDDCVLSDFAIEEKGRLFEVFLRDDKVRSEQMRIYAPPLLEEDMSPEHLVAWLVREIRDPEKRIDGETLQGVVEKNLAALKDGGISIAQIWRGRNQLAAALRDWLQAHMIKVSQETAEEFLFGNADVWCEYRPRFTPDFNYHAHCGGWIYIGGYRFNKHYYGAPGSLKSSGEEFHCAVAIDSSEDVRYWVRNVPKQKNSYALPLGAGKNFYPDFVVELNNGKTLIVEYKGEVYLGESKDKNRAGEKLHKASKGQCFFAMPSRQGKQTAAAIHQQVNAAIRKAMAA